MLAFLLVWWLWGSLSQVSTIHDEAAYLLQARIFASGRLVGPPRPLPEFFDQYHVLVQPVLAAKYPPGYSLLLVPGVWIGLPGLVVGLLVASTSTLLFVLARRVENGAVAALTVLLANTSGIALQFNPTYFAEVATTTLFMLAWWALLEHWQTGKRRWLMLLAGVVGWGAITRPLTMLAFAIPAGIAILVSIRRHNAWRDIVPPLAIVFAILAIFPLWNAIVIGDWHKSLYAEYAQRYIPSDRIGFGTTDATPSAPLSEEQQLFAGWVRETHRTHVASALPEIAAARAAFIARGTWVRGAIPGVAALIGVLLLPIGISRLLVGTAICVFTAYLAYAHPPTWTVYYLELQPVFAFLTAVGLYGAVTWLARKLTDGGRFSRHLRFLSRATSKLGQPEVTAILFSAVIVWLVAPLPRVIIGWRREEAQQRAYRARFQRILQSVSRTPAIVFVRYGAGHSFHESLIDNDPDLASSRIWIVHDRGADNSRLAALDTNRKTYLYREVGQGAQLRPILEPLAVVPRKDSVRPP
jgi:hypothetical protein